MNYREIFYCYLIGLRAIKREDFIGVIIEHPYVVNEKFYRPIVGNDTHALSLCTDFGGLTHIADMLCKANANLNGVELNKATMNSSPRTIQVLLDNGLDMNKIYTQYDNSTLLHIAIEKPTFNEIALRLINEGANLTILNDLQETPLDVAFRHARFTLFVAIIDKGGASLDIDLVRLFKSMVKDEEARWFREMQCNCISYALGKGLIDYNLLRKVAIQECPRLIASEILGENINVTTAKRRKIS